MDSSFKPVTLRGVAGWVCALLLGAGAALAQDADQSPQPNAVPADVAAADAPPADTAATDALPADAATDLQPSAAQPEPGAAVTRFELQIDLEDLLAAADYSAAAELGGALIALAAAEFGTDSTMFAETLLLVAEAQSLNGDFDAAEENALQALEIYRQQDGSFAESLIRPYLALGDNYYKAEDYVSAVSSYEEARNVSRRVNGLLNPGQIEILDRLSASAEGLDQMTDAEEYQREALELVERRYSPHSSEVIEAALRYGQWLRDHNMFTPERELYGRVERAVAEQYGVESVQLVPLLLARGNSYRSQALYDVQGISALRLARDILETDPDTRLLAQAYRDLGDWEAAFYERGTDGTAYLASWALLGDLEDGGAVRAEWYGTGPAQFVLIAARSQRGFSTDRDAATGRLIIQFTVQPNGLTTDVRITDADPPGIAEEAFARQIRASRFRPVIRAGRLVPARRAFSATFRYDPKDDD